MATRQRNSSQQGAPSPLGYIIFGIIIGLGIAVAGAYYFRTNPFLMTTSRVTTTKTAPQPAVSPTPTPPPVIITSPPPAPVLPVVAEQPSTSSQPAPNHDQIGALINGINNSTTPKIVEKKYIPTYLQVGSFKSEEEANAKRAQLLLQGFTNISINKAKINNTDFFRVRLGPYTSEVTLKAAQNQLKKSSIHATPTR